MAKEYKYSAFISYAREDRRFAVRLENDLQRYVLPKAKELLGEKRRRRPFPDVFRDESRLVPGADLPARIQFGLENSEFLIVICSPTAVKSEWVKKEITDFIGFGGERRILAVIVDGEPNALKNKKSAESEALPLPLRFTIQDGAVTDTPCPEPLWVDWRGQKHGDRLNFLRLVAALLGFEDLDELIRHDQERERQARRRLRMIAAGVTALAILSIISALAAYNQRQQALESQSKFLAEMADSLPPGDPAQLLLALEALPSTQGALFPRRDVDEAARSVISAASYIKLGAIVRADSVFDWDFSPGSDRIVTAGSDFAQQWDVNSGAPIGAPMKHKKEVTRAEFSPDGSRIVTVSVDNFVRLWNARTQVPVGVPMKHDDYVSAVQFSPDGNRLMTVSGRTVRLWDAHTGAMLGKEITAASSIAIVKFSKSATFSPDGLRIVTISEDHSVQLWDAFSGAQIGVPMIHGASISSVAFSSDGTRIVTASDDGTVRLWDGRTGVSQGTLVKHDKEVLGAVFSPDGLEIVTAYADGPVVLWNTHTRTAIGEPMTHGSAAVSAAFSPDGRHLLTVSFEGTARLWDAHTGVLLGELMRHDDRITSAVFSPDGNLVLTDFFLDDNAVWLWNVHAAAPLATPFKFDGNLPGRITSNNSECIEARFEGGGTVRLWNVCTNSLFSQVVLKNVPWDGATGTELSPDGSRVVMYERGGDTRLWDVRTGEPIGLPLVNPDNGDVMGIMFSPDSSRFFIVYGDHLQITPWLGMVQIYDARTGAALGALMKHPNRVRDAEYSHDSSRIVTASADGNVRLWDAHTGALLRAPMELRLVKEVAFLPNDSQVVAISDDGTALKWDIGRPPLIGSGSELARKACAVLPKTLRNFSASNALREQAQQASLNPDVPGPCDRYGLLSHYYWFGLADDVWTKIKGWSHAACVGVRLCKQHKVPVGQAAN